MILAALSAQAAEQASPALAWAANIGKIVLGALIGFGTTYWFAHRSERARNRGLGHSLVLRVNETTQFILRMHQMLLANLAEFDRSATPFKWLAVQTPAGFDWRENVSFPAEEMAILADGNHNELLTKLGELARLHNVVRAITVEYAKRREALVRAVRELGGPSVVDGASVRTPLTAEALQTLQPDAIVLENLLESLLSMLEKGAEFSKQIATEIGPTIRRVLRDKKFKMGLSFD